MLQRTGYFIRNTFVNYEHLKTLPTDRQEKIKELTAEFNKLGYIDATVEIGPNQWARTSAKQRNNISNKAIQAFDIESQIKQLLKTNAQLQKDEEEKQQQQKHIRVNYITNRIKMIEQFLQRKLNSNRENPTKKEYRELNEELITLTTPLTI